MSLKDVFMNTKKVPKNPDQRRVWVRWMLELNGSSFAAIGRELKPPVTRGAVRHCQWRKSPRMEEAVAGKIGFKPEQIWPERY